MESFERASTQDKATSQAIDDRPSAVSNLNKRQEQIHDYNESFRIRQGSQAKAPRIPRSSETQSFETLSDDEFTGMEDVTMDELQSLVDEADSQLKARRGNAAEENELSRNAADTITKHQNVVKINDPYDDDDDLWQNIDENTLLQHGQDSNATNEVRFVCSAKYSAC